MALLVGDTHQVFVFFGFGTLGRVRDAAIDTIASREPEELLTTGEAAALLGSSRQHVVDLCQRGALSFTTTGKHRRVRRGDVEAIRDRTQRLTRDQRRSLWLAYAVAAHIVDDPPAAVAVARANLGRMRKAVRGVARLWLDEWEHLLDGPVDELLDVFTSRSPRARELRQNSPFAGLLGEEERLRVLAAWRAIEHAGPR